MTMLDFDSMYLKEAVLLKYVALHLQFFAFLVISLERK